MMHRPRSLIYATIAALLSSTTGCATVRLHPAFQERQTAIRTIAALPPEVAIYRLTFKGDQELMPELIPVASDTIIHAAETTLRRKGYTVPHLNPNDPELTADVRAAMFDVQQIFTKRVEEMAKRGFPKRGAYSVGPEVNRFADMSRSDALLFAQCEGIKKSGGEITKDIAKTLLIGIATLGSLVMVYPTSATVLQLAVVDGNTGDILWYHSTLLSGKAEFDVANQRELAAKVQGLLKPFPRAAGATTARASTPRGGGAETR